MIFLPQAFDDLEPLTRACVTIVMLFEFHAVLPRLVRPPRRHDVQRKPTIAADVIDVCGLLGEKCRLMKRWTHCDHQLERRGDCCQRRSSGPRIERRCFDALDVVEIEFGNQRQIVSELFTATRQLADVVPTRFHPLVFDVSQPTAENREPVTVAHRLISSCRKSTSRACGSKPITRGASATKFESALMS